MLRRELPIGLLLAVATVLACGAWAQNIYPDPGFEQSGTPGVARTGEKAGHLKVEAENHWVPLGGEIKVEPFATYRVTVWAKGRAAKGTIYAPYTYEWDNFVWNFSSTAPLKPTDEWTQGSATFVSPYDHMVVHPIALLDCADAEAWVDDVVVEKIAEPDETMKAMMAKPEPNPAELGIIARYLLASRDWDRRGAPLNIPLVGGLFHDRLDAVRALIGKGPAGASADIACLLAQQETDPEGRKPYIVQMVQYGALTMNNGLNRFNEVTEGMTAGERVDLCVQAVLADPNSVAAAKGFALVAKGAAPGLGGLTTTAESEALLNAFQASLAKLLQAIPANSPARTEVAAVSDTVAQQREKLAERKARLGACTIRIGGKTLDTETHAIVIPDEPTPQEGYAAKDLRYHLELVTGKTFDVVPESQLGKRTPIIVGKCALLKDRGFPVVPADLGIEGLYVATKGPVLALVGNRRGVLYAVSTFLEDYVGCRWFTPDCSTWPTTGTIKVPKLNRTYIPPLEYRAGDYPVARPGEFALHCRFTGNGRALSEEQGGQKGVHGLAHTFAGLVPPEKYFKDHPEYFSLVNGKRQSGYAQLCLTNPDVLKIVIEGVRRWIKEYPTDTVFSVSQNDTANYCECDKCRAVAEEEGSQSGPMIRFVNAVADNIKDDYPNVAIETLAYQYTRKPPLHVRPRPNVIVCLCSIECCFIHPLATDPFNKSFVDDIRGWSKICQRLWIWDYIINYAHSIMPFPNLYVLKPNINFFLQNGVTGIYEESCYYTKGSELQELRNYIIAKTLWDPSYDTDKAIDEFCAAYYGAAAPMVREYINTIQQSAQSLSDVHVRIYSPPSVGYLTPEVLAKSAELFDRAERAVRDDPVLLHRVEVARLPLLYSQIVLGQGSTYVEQGDRLVTTSSAAIPDLARKFERIARAEGVTRLREGGPLADLDAWLESLPTAASGMAIERIGNSALDLAILPDLGGRIWRMRLKPSGRDLIKVYGKEGAWDPSQGGYEEYSESEYRSPGWSEAYNVVDKTDRSIRLECKLKNGLELSRLIEVDPDNPVVHVTSTLTNISNAPKTVTFRIHPALQVDTTQQATVRLKHTNGEWTDQSLANPKDPTAELNVWLRDADVPAGEWSIVDQKAGVTLTQTFDPAQVSQCLLNWSGKDGRVNLELYSRQAELKAGESLTVDQTYGIVAK
jgi:hypothetical protein